LALGDFHTADLGMRADAVLAIESFAHSDDADAFLANAARHLRPGGRLIVADDFLASEPEALSGRQRLRVEQLRAGWRVPAVCTSARLAELAAAHGLATEKVVDLTPLTRPGSRVRDRLIAAVSPLLARLALAHIPFWGNIIGGNALQVGLREGFLRYQLLVLRRLDC
jgi:SAM-dependent methyltransferase